MDRFLNIHGLEWTLIGLDIRGPSWTLMDNSKLEQIELPAKLLDYFSWSNKLQATSFNRVLITMCQK